MSRRIALVVIALAVIVAGCGDDEVAAPVPSSNLVLNLNGLEPLTGGYHYEGWAILGSPVSTGKFNVGSGSQLVSLSGTAIAGNSFATGLNLSAAAAIVITIEPPGDTNAIPAATKYLGGNVSSGSASLAAGHAAALGNDFTTATGKYILATPTNGNSTNENSGIWFLSLASGSPAQGLSLPVLPGGWKYEGWVVIAGSPVTTGTFTNPSVGDQGAPYSDNQSAPPFPGEDFLLNAPAPLTFPTDIANGRAVISIEPDPDPSSAPFTLKPLNGLIPAGAVDHVTYDIDNVASQFPTGSATIQ